MDKFGRNGRTVHFFETIDSTNARAKAEAESGAESGTLIVADRQTAGRGRHGRVWESPGGTNLYFTLILRPDLAPDKASMLTLVMALAVAKSIEWANPGIKWPNDIVINGKKVCGILTEMSVQQNKIEHVLVGVGVNVHKQEFTSELVDKATDIESECGQKISRNKLLADIIKAFDEYNTIFEKQGDLAELRELYNGKLVNCNREVCVLDPQGEYTGIATGINETGELCVVLPDGRQTYVYAGEVSVRGIYGYV